MLRFNPDLTEFVEIDTKKFLAAMSHLVEKKGLTLPNQPSLWASEVRYTGREFSFDLDSRHDGFDVQNLGPMGIDAVAFRKPIQFSHEKEFRVVINSETPIGSKGMLFSSQHLKRALLPLRGSLAA